MPNKAGDGGKREENVDAEIVELPVFDFVVLVQVRLMLRGQASKGAALGVQVGQAVDCGVRRPRGNPNVGVGEKNLVAQQRDDPEEQIAPVRAQISIIAEKNRRTYNRCNIPE